MSSKTTSMKTKLAEGTENIQQQANKCVDKVKDSDLTGKAKEGEKTMSDIANDGLEKAKEFNEEHGDTILEKAKEGMEKVKGFFSHKTK